MLYNFYDHRKPAPLNLSVYTKHAEKGLEYMEIKRDLIVKKSKCQDKAERDLLSIRINLVNEILKKHLEAI